MTDHPTHLSALDAYDDLENIEDAAQALSLVVAAFLDDDLLPLDALYTNPLPCRLLLTRDEELYTVLKESYASKNFTPIRNSGALRRQKVGTDILKRLNKLRPAIVDFINQKGFPVWSPKPETVSDENLRAHIASLGVPSVSDLPRLLLRDLGSFSHNVPLFNRTNNIFSKGHHTFLVNTSGSGKTRLTFEGLCQNWGFYFVGNADANGVGSEDLERLLNHYIPHPPSFHKYLAPHSRSQAALEVTENIKITRRCLRHLLLCRLFVFSMFAEHVHAAGISAEHKKLWLLIQAYPQIIAGGLFGDIFGTLLMDVRYLDDTRTKDHIACQLVKLREVFGNDFHIFFAIDEAQLIFGYHKNSFEENRVQYPILREIIDGLTAELPRHEVSFLTVGTEIPQAGFQNSLNVGQHRWVSDTGAFDNEDLHREYVSQFLPPSYLETKAGKSFVQRVWDWCRGRYRFTDTLMSALMEDGFRSPHTLLNNYIEIATGFRPADNGEFARSENGKCADIGIMKVNFDSLGTSEFDSLTSDVQDVLFHYAATGQHPDSFDVAHVEIVNHLLGRFIDGDMSQIVIDEPIMLVGAAHKLCCTNSTEDTDHCTFKDSFFDILKELPPLSPRTLSNALVIYLTHAFSEGHLLSKVFSFPHKIPAWTKQKAEIVAFHRDTAVDTSLSGVLATAPKSLEDTVSWLVREEAEHPPFCLPFSGPPNLVFVLRLADGSFIRTILHASFTTSVLKNSDLRRIIVNMDDGNLFPGDVNTSFLFFPSGLTNCKQDPELHGRAISALQTVPSAPTDRGRRVLRVIASFPAATHLKSATNKDTRGIANLNTGIFRTQTAKIPASTILKIMVEAVTLGKRKRRSETPSAEVKRQKATHRSPPAARHGSRSRA
ncbi:hypothetical protein C8R43DRAFT_1104968 [Mycena crocata]|nr:hypothetical protein C8R43DRAFT_1104968 [Mycena crocata]